MRDLMITLKPANHGPKDSSHTELGKKRPDQDLYCVRNYESSHTGHGTVMAYYIRRICPNVQLYVAKLNPETQPGDGTGSSNQKLIFSMESAAAVRSCNLSAPSLPRIRS